MVVSDPNRLSFGVDSVSGSFLKEYFQSVHQLSLFFGRVFFLLFLLLLVFYGI